MYFFALNKKKAKTPSVSPLSPIKSIYVNNFSRLFLCLPQLVSSPSISPQNVVRSGNDPMIEASLSALHCLNYGLSFFPLYL